MAEEAVETAAERIIWSADVENLRSVTDFLDDAPELKRVKIDRLFVDRNDEFVFGVLKDRGIDVFYDAKFIEIPSKLEELAKQAVSHEPWMVNCMAGAVSNGVMLRSEQRDEIDGLRRFADVCLSAQVLPCAVTVLTSKSLNLVRDEFNGRSATEQVLWYVEGLIMAGFTDLVCSPQEALAIYQQFGSAIKTNTPAIRFDDGDAGDQARVMTPARAIENMADRLIMGRPLTNGDRKANFARAVAEVETALVA